MSYLLMRILTSSGSAFPKVADVRSPVWIHTTICGFGVREGRHQDLSGGEKQEQQQRGRTEGKLCT